MTKRKQMRAETWIKLKVKPEEIEESKKDNENLRENVEEKAADLYNKMQQGLANPGKD